MAPQTYLAVSRSLSVVSEPPFSAEDTFDSRISGYHLHDMPAFTDFPWLQGSVLGQDWASVTFKREDAGAGAVILKGS
jgi:hypothetical protein